MDKFKIKEEFYRLFRPGFSKHLYIKTDLNYECEDKSCGIPHQMEYVFEKVEEERIEPEENTMVYEINSHTVGKSWSTEKGPSVCTNFSILSNKPINAINPDLFEKFLNGDLVEKEELYKNTTVEDWNEALSGIDKTFTKEQVIERVNEWIPTFILDDDNPDVGCLLDGEDIDKLRNNFKQFINSK